ncbi:MAG: DUF3854 domain-containing protein [Chloroflexota bacterium]|nr:DUF3854 domain-containing protein [Chloroflexota bacterium]
MTATVPGLLPHHARELFAGSGIDPAVAAGRGYRSVVAAECGAYGFAPAQCGDGRLDPQWSLAGVQVGFKLKRDHPRTDDKGRQIKYEHPAGAGHDFDIHPGACHVLRDPATTLYFTEGNKKADAAWSRGVPTVSICGVFMFLHGRLVVPDLDEIALADRPVRVVFDSDVTRKPAVAEALLRFCAALRRRGARVEVVYLPEGPNGEKTGFDDFFVRGGTPDDLDRFARPWRDEGPGVWLRGASDDDVDELRRQRDAARADYTALAQAVLNPEVSRAQLVAVTSATAHVLAKQQRGEVEPDGRVVLSAAEIADDWRPAPAPGERIAPTNPSGSRPRLARERVRTIIAPAVESGLIAAKPRVVQRQHANGSTYRDTLWVFDPIPSIAAALDPWAAYRPAEPSVRKPRTTARPCPACGEAHPVLRRDACTGCGTILSEKTIDAEPATASDNLSEATTTAPKDPPPAPRNVVRSFIGGDPVPEEPAWLAAAPAPDDVVFAPDPPLAAARPHVAAADHAPDQATRRRANDDLFAHLAAKAAASGRPSFPKPRPETALPTDDRDYWRMT